MDPLLNQGLKALAPMSPESDFVFCGAELIYNLSRSNY